MATLLAAVSGNDAIDRESVARWERGKRKPGPYWQQWLAAALDLPPYQSGAASRRASSVDEPTGSPAGAVSHRER